MAFQPFGMNALRQAVRPRMLFYLGLVAVSFASWSLLRPHTQGLTSGQDNVVWISGIAVQVACLVVFLVGTLVWSGVFRFGIRNWFLREGVEPPGKGQSKEWGYQDIVGMLTGCILLLVTWLYFKVFIVLFLAGVLVFSTIRAWLNDLLRQDPLYAWKRLNFIPLDRLTEVYWHTAFLYFTFASLQNVLVAITTESLVQKADVLSGTIPGLIATYAGTFSSPWPVLMAQGERSDGLETHISTIRSTFNPDVGLLLVFSLFFAALLFWLARLFLTVPAWQHEVQAAFREETVLGAPPTAIAGSEAKAANRSLAAAVGLNFVYTVLASWFGLFLVANILLYLVGDIGWPMEGIVLPFAWMEALLASHLPAGVFIAKGVLSFFALCLLVPPLYYLAYRTSSLLRTLRRVQTQRIEEQPITELISALSRRTMSNMAVVFNANLASPTSYRFLGMHIIEWPWKGLPPANDRGASMEFACFYLAHELHHLRYHAGRIRILQVLSGMTLVSHNYLTLAVDSLAYELAADAGAVAVTGNRDAAVAALTWLREQADVLLALRFGQPKSIVAQLTDFQFGSDVVGYLHPTLESRIAALRKLQVPVSDNG